MNMNNFMNQMLDFVTFRTPSVQLMAVRVMLVILAATILFLPPHAGAPISSNAISGMESTWVVDLIFVKLEGFHWG